MDGVIVKQNFETRSLYFFCNSNLRNTGTGTGLGTNMSVFSIKHWTDPICCTPLFPRALSQAECESPKARVKFRTKFWCAAATAATPPRRHFESILEGVWESKLHHSGGGVKTLRKVATVEAGRRYSESVRFFGESGTYFMLPFDFVQMVSFQATILIKNADWIGLWIES